MWDEMDLVGVNIIIEGDYFGFFVDIFGVGYPGELVLLAKHKGGIDVEDVEGESPIESSGVRGVVS